MNKFNRKGITLVELIITLAIFAMVISIAYPFFISNFKFLNSAQSEVEYQSQGQRAIDKIVSVAMESKGISSIEFGHNSEGNSKEIKKITFLMKMDTETFIFDDNSGMIYYYKGNNEIGKIEIAKGIKYVGVGYIPAVSDFSQAKGILLNIKPVEYKSLETQGYFRNKQ